MALKDRKYLRFLHNGVAYEFQILCYGLHPAPYIFTKLGRVVVLHCRHLGIFMLIYLDDMIVTGETEEICVANAQTLINLLAHLGLHINYKKCQLIPSQQFFFLGFM